MARFLNAKALGLALVALVVMAAMSALGYWQFRVYDDQQQANAKQQLLQRPVPLGSLLGPDRAFPSDAVGRPVTVSGRYLAADQLYVRGMAGATSRYAVVTPLVTANGSAVLVVRGASGTLGAPVPTGAVTVRGVLEPSGGASRPLDRRRVASGLSIPSLVSAVKPDLYSGYVLARSTAPPDSAHLDQVVPPLPHPSRWAGLRNLLYACQWWLFAAFVAFMWWRMTGDLIRPQARRAPPTESAGAGSGSVSALR